MRHGDAGLGLELRAGTGAFGLPVAGPADADQHAVVLRGLDVEEGQVLVAGRPFRAELHAVEAGAGQFVEADRPPALQGDDGVGPIGVIGEVPVAGVADRQVERLAAPGIQVDPDGGLAAAQHGRVELRAAVGRQGKHDRARVLARQLVRVNADPGGKVLDGRGRMDAEHADGIDAEAVLELPLADHQRRLDDRAVDLHVARVLPEQRQRGAGRSANLLRHRHVVVQAATTAAGAVNRVAPARLGLIELEVEVSHVLDDGRILAAGVFKRQQGIQRGIIEEALDVPGGFQSRLDVQPSPLLGREIRLVADVAAMELPVATGAGKILAVVAKAEGQRGAEPVVEPALSGLAALLAGGDGLEPRIDQGNFALGRKAAFGQMRGQRDRPVGGPHRGGRETKEQGQGQPAARETSSTHVAHP